MERLYSLTRGRSPPVIALPMLENRQGREEDITPNLALNS